MWQNNTSHMEVSFKEDIPATQSAKKQKAGQPLFPPKISPGVTNGPTTLGSLVIVSILGSALLLSIWLDFLFFKELASAFLIIGILWKFKQAGEASISTEVFKQAADFKPNHPRKQESALYTPEHH